MAIPSHGHNRTTVMLVPLVTQGYSFLRCIRARLANIGCNLEHRESLKAAEVRYLTPAQPGPSPTGPISFLEKAVAGQFPFGTCAGCEQRAFGPLSQPCSLKGNLPTKPAYQACEVLQGPLRQSRTQAVGPKPHSEHAGLHYLLVTGSAGPAARNLGRLPGPKPGPNCAS